MTIRTNIKIGLSEATGLFNDYIAITDVKNIDSLSYSGNIGGGQGEIDIEIGTNYDNSNFIENQLIEISAYNYDNPAGILKYAGFIKNINRTLSKEQGESIQIEVLGLSNILGEYSGTFTKNEPLDVIIGSFITQFHGIYNISSTMEFIGTDLFKNGIIDVTNVNITKTGTYFEILEEIFILAGKTFFISKNGTINLGDQSTVKHILTWNKEITEMKISGTRETEINLVGFDYDIEPGDKIILENINSNYNLDNQRVEKVEYSLLETTIYLGNIWSLGTQIIKV